MVKTVIEILTLYLRKGNAENKLSSRQRDDSCGIVLKQFFKGKKISDARLEGMVCGADVTDYRNWRKAQGVKPSTIAREITVMSAAIKYCNNELDWDLDNKFRDRQYSVSDKRNKVKRTRTCSTEEIELLLSHSNGLLHDLIKFYLSTGFRAREALTLRSQNITGDVAKILAEDSKSGKEELRLLLPDAKEILSRQSEHKYAFSKDGKPVSYWWLRNQWQKLRVEIGSPDLIIHDLRRTAGDTMRLGFGLEAAQLLLGHASKSTTESVYAVPKLDKLRSIMMCS
jgi:integrase